jgi:hypothetical protein
MNEALAEALRRIGEDIERICSGDVRTARKNPGESQSGGKPKCQALLV